MFLISRYHGNLDKRFHTAGGAALDAVVEIVFQGFSQHKVAAQNFPKLCCHSKQHAVCADIVLMFLKANVFVFDGVALFPGSKACGEGIEASERHPGGEGERQPAEPAAGGLQQGELLPEQPGAH